jgi:zinc/manganese transport system permease protein
VIQVAGALYAASVAIGPVGGLLWQVFPGRHLEA